MTVGTLEVIKVKVSKYDGTEYRHWNARLARRERSLMVLDAKFETNVQHELLGEISRGTRTVEYYWLDRWYSVFRFLNDLGTTKLYYCNVNTPPKFYNGVLSYIDLDIDIVVQPDLSYQILDLEEFEANGERYGYSEEVSAQALAAVDELSSMIDTRQFPFGEAT